MSSDDVLSWLDKNTDWDDEDEDEGGSLVPNEPPNTMDEGGAEAIVDILDAVDGMEERKEIADIIVLVNTNDSDMLLFTNLDRNDIIIGRLASAQMNWWSTQVDLQSLNDEGDEEGVL